MPRSRQPASSGWGARSKGRATAEADSRRVVLHAAARPLPGGGLVVGITAERFLRRQVRVIVATALREAARDGEVAPDALVALTLQRDRRRTAKPAPPEGLCLARVYQGSITRADLAVAFSCLAAGDLDMGAVPATLGSSGQAVLENLAMMNRGAANLAKGPRCLGLE